MSDTCKIQDLHCTIDTSVVLTTGEGVLASMDANLLKTLPLAKDWVKGLLMGIVILKLMHPIMMLDNNFYQYSLNSSQHSNL